MGFLSGGGLNQSKEKLRRTISSRKNVVVSKLNDVVPKGHFPVYVGERHRRFVIPLRCLKHPLFQELLRLSEQEFGYDHPMGGLTIPCSEDYFLSLISSDRLMTNSFRPTAV